MRYSLCCCLWTGVGRGVEVRTREGKMDEERKDGRKDGGERKVRKKKRERRGGGKRGEEERD